MNLMTVSEARYLENANLLINKEPKYTFFIPGWVESNTSISPQIFKSWFANLEGIDECDLIYIYGLGGGESYSFFKPFLSKKGKALVYFEDDERGLFNFLKSPLAKEILLDPSVHLFFKLNEEEDNFNFLDSALANFFSGKVRIFSSPALTTLQKNKLPSFQNKIMRLSTYYAASHIDHLYSYQNFSHFYKNVEKIPFSFNVNFLKDKFKGIPALICGAGPSLSKEIKEIKKIEDKALIIAGGSAITALLSYGLRPHLGVVIDPNDDETVRMEKTGGIDIPILYSTRVHSGVFEYFNGLLGYFSSVGQGLEGYFFEKEVGLSPSYFIGQDLTREAFSVTTTNLELAKFFGCSPIILCGVDLCYEKGRRYATGVLEGENKIVVSKSDPGESLIEKKGVVTTVKWEMESDVISAYKKAQRIEIINTSFGLEIEGVLPLKLERVVKEYLKRKIDVKKRVEKEISLAKMRVSVYKIKKFKEELKKSFLKSHEIISEINNLVEKSSSSSFKSLSLNISLLERELKEEIAYKYFLVRPFKALERVLSSWYQEKKEIDYLSDLWHNFLEVSSKYLEALTNTDHV
jgi:hypothetical protein